MEEIEQVLNISCSYIHGFERFEKLDMPVTLAPPKPSIEEAPKLELKPLPSYLRYAYLGSSETLQVIISSSLIDVQEEKLLRVFREHKKAIGWTIADIKGINPSFCMHKIFLEDGHRPSIEKQRRLNLIMKEVMKKEVIKWLDADCHMPKGLGEDHFYLSLWYFHFQANVVCNAPTTFHRCMMAIFIDMVEIFVEVFMDDFSVFGSSYDDCLKNLSKVLDRCEETNLVLNWKNCHFIVQEGIVLGHIVSRSGIQVDKAKVERVEKLPPPISVKGFWSFLGHAGFYRRFIKDFQKLLLFCGGCLKRM
ncbi:uncharacterized protein LOC142169733 [Nicotiana tabacum]|uniref:Uncharacterized protein LOC142169733 n=1 Tax=Nicotiana tabacum TaxID=4097 RepID=A0AC58SRX8_TOBAC